MLIFFSKYLVVELSMQYSNFPSNTYNHHSQSNSQIYALKSKPTSIYASKNAIYIPLADKTVGIFDPQSGSFLQRSNIAHNDRINCIKQKDNMLITGSNDSTVKLWDMKMANPIATFQKIPAQFNCVDKSGYILAAAYSSKIVFWDLRTGKQRSQFTSSFNGEITTIQFDQKAQTILMGCSSDGMINKFDLKQTNQQQAFLWCTKIMQSPSKLQFIDDITLVQTTNHLLYILQEEGAIKQKIQVNNSQEPKHVVYSKLVKEESSKYQVQHFNWNLQSNYVEYVVSDKICGYIPDVTDIEFFCPLKNNKVLLVEQSGNVFVKPLQHSLSKSKITSNTNFSQFSELKIKNQSISNQKQKQISLKFNQKINNGFLNDHKKSNYSDKNYNDKNGHKSDPNKMETEQVQQVVKIDKNGYILQKQSTSSLKNKNKKFKPY